jgi:hypothetical protein
MLVSGAVGQTTVVKPVRKPIGHQLCGSCYVAALETIHWWQIGGRWLTGMPHSSLSTHG